MNKTAKIFLGLLGLSVVAYFIFRKKPETKDTLIEDLKGLAKSMNDTEVKTLNSILDSFKSPKNKFTEEENQKWLRVYKGILLAKKDKKWDDKSKDVKAKKAILLSYGVNINDLEWFIKQTS